MLHQLLTQIREFNYFGFNALEIFGMGAIFCLLVVVVLRIRESLSGNISREKLLARPAPRETPVSQKVDSDLPKGRETILIVDDDAAVLRAHSRLVSKLGYNVERAPSGRDAVEFIRNQQADLIILDLLMPEMDGMETFRAIKKINPNQRAIVLSGFAGPAMVSAIKALGVGTYLVKPAQVSMLARAIREELDRDMLN